jgi:hypothetical protein
LHISFDHLLKCAAVTFAPLQRPRQVDYLNFQAATRNAHTFGPTDRLDLSDEIYLLS